MSAFHDPMKQVRFLRESIQLGKKPVGFFLGAGCPMAVTAPGGSGPLIPDIATMTTKVLQKLKDDKSLSKSAEKLCSHFKPETSANLETYLSHLRSLISISGGEAVRGLSLKDMESLEKEICKGIYDLVNVPLPDSESPYHQLVGWIGSLERAFSIDIFTTNYDLLLEQAMEELRVPYFDGFIGSRNAFFDPYAIDEEEMPRRWTGLWKLHGSINWKQVPGTNRVARVSVADIGLDDSRLIHPSHMKYDESRRMPYLAMIDRMKTFLRQPSCMLVTLGYSFGDEHLNEVIRQGLARNQNAHCFGLLFNDLDTYNQASELACGRSNLSLLAPRDACVGGVKAPYLSREFGDVDSQESIEITWPEIDGKSSRQANFHLGNFAKFGAFLQEMIGSEHLIRSLSEREGGGDDVD